MTYKRIYQFNVLDEIKKRSIVYYLDRKYNEVGCINTMQTANAVFILGEAENDDTNRYEFWIEDTEENENA